MKGWEIDEQRADGKWYVISRNFENGANISYTRWLNYQPASIARRFSLREVTELDEPLNASPTPNPLPAKEQNMTYAQDLDTANKEGQALAYALYMLFGKPNPDGKALFAIARRFAKYAGYSDTDEAFSFIEGFVQAFQDAATQPALAAPGGGNSSSIESLQ